MFRLDIDAAKRHLEMIDPTGQLKIATPWKSIEGDEWHEMRPHRNSAAALRWLSGFDVSQGHLFICDSPIAGNRRKDGQTAGARLVRADFDRDKAPGDLRIPDELAPYVNLYHSGRPGNYHLRIELEKRVKHATIRTLNYLLMKLVHGDSKYSDSAVLRVVGSVNHKTGETVQLATQATAGPIGASLLARMLTRLTGISWADATEHSDKTANGSGTWDVVDLGSIRPQWRNYVRIPLDAYPGYVGPNTDLSALVWATVRDMVLKGGLTDHQIHTVLDQSALVNARLEKNRAHNVHEDIQRCIDRARKSADAVQDSLANDDESGAIEVVDAAAETDDDREALIQHFMRQTLAREEARARLAAGAFVEPDANRYGSLATLMQRPLSAHRYLVGAPLINGQAVGKGILGEKHNAVLIAQWKSGKTTFAMDLAKSLVDGDEFLGVFPIAAPTTVGFWSLEVEINELLGDFVLPMGFQNPSRMHVFDGVGARVNILTDVGKAWATEWLRAGGVKVWMIDSLSVLAVWCGVNIDKDNVDTRKLFVAIDEIKAAAGVDVSFVLAHTPRAEMEDGKERARGASAIDEHAGARWILTVEGDIRFLRVNGRGVELAQTSLAWNSDTRRASLGVGDKAATRLGVGVTLAEDLVRENNGKLNATSLKAKIKETLASRGLVHGAQVLTDIVRDAQDLGFIVAHAGIKPGSKLFSVPEKPSGAQVAVVDFSRTPDRKR